ncbi:ENTH domain-containing protein C794.11c-like [Cynara cardunculus var. scolymus]|uniref:ENTH domain-containing protein C794.11c-like n=1 Tax=Cynara cardunculus var. scolymus TaxID=59895 RepID=UPI000D630685|nr:ENTH domain-containing protein C794.11c-like [Cynara cardunculus var. scolymus]
MSILGNNENLGSSSSFHEFRRHASFFLKEKIKTARLALTDVTPAQLLVEESTNGNPWAPDARTLKMISKAAFEIDDYWRIVNVLHNRLVRFDAKNWRISYKAVVVLEHLLTHGPESVAEEFRTHKDVMQQMTNFQYIDEKGFNWGLNVRMKSERILKFLNESSALKEERSRARKLSRGIEGFGSFNHKVSSDHGVLQPSFLDKYKRSNSQFIEDGFLEENQISPMIQHENSESRNPIKKPAQNSGSSDGFGENLTVNTLGSQWSSKENMAPKEDRAHVPKEMDESILIGESNPLLGDWKNESRVTGKVDKEDHPFNDEENEAKMSLI